LRISRSKSPYFTQISKNAKSAEEKKLTATVGCKPAEMEKSFPAVAGRLRKGENSFIVVTGKLREYVRRIPTTIESIKIF
jgi:hypothetical protein